MRQPPLRRHSPFPRSTVMRLLLLPLLFAAIPLAAQGERWFSIHNGPGYIDTDVSFYLEGDIITVTVPAPATSVQAVNAVENAIRARGYQVSRADPNTICVTAGPGGSLLRDGHGITTDGLSGYWLDLDRGQRPPAARRAARRFCPRSHGRRRMERRPCRDPARCAGGAGGPPRAVRRVAR